MTIDPITIPREFIEAMPPDYGRSKGISWYFLNPPNEQERAERWIQEFAQAIRRGSRKITRRQARRAAKEVIIMLGANPWLLKGGEPLPHERSFRWNSAV